jgi:hypothetical protein
MFIGSIFFEFLGAVMRWAYIKIKSNLTGQRPLNFSAVYNGRKKADDQEKLEYAFSNVILGMVVTVLTLSLLVWLTS